MAINFPNSPTIGDLYTFANTTWKWSGEYWGVLTGSTGDNITFLDSDFNDTGNRLISIDYTNAQSASSSTKGFLTSTDWSTFNNKQDLLVSNVNIKTINNQSILGSGNITITAGTSNDGVLSVSGITPINVTGTNNPVISISNAAADGATKGGATFNSSDFNDNGSGLISIDYTNAQSASSSTKGFLTSTDWTTFNSKQNQLNGTGFVKASGTTITYDDTTYYPTSNPSGYITSTALSPYLTSATAASTYVPLTRNITINGQTQNLSADRTWTISVSASTTGGVTGVTASPPLSSSGGIGPNITIQQSSSSQDGFLSSSDWTTFNNKQNQISLTTTGNTGPATFDPTTGKLNVPQYGGEEGSGLGYPLYFGCSPSNIGIDSTTYVFGPSFWGDALRITNNRSSRYLRALKSGRVTSANIIVQWSGEITGPNLTSDVSIVKKSGITEPESELIILSGLPMSTNDISYDGNDPNFQSRNTFHLIETPFFVQQQDLVQIRFTTPNWPSSPAVPEFSMTVVVFVE